MERADRLIAEGEQAEAEQNWFQACEHYRKAIGVSPRYAKARLKLGVALEHIGDIDGATASYEAALAIDQGEAYAGYNLGKLLYSRGIFDRSENLLRGALLHKPDFPEAHLVLSCVHEAQGNLDAAMVSLETALRHRPAWIGALFNYAELLRKLGRHARAEAALSQVIALEPENAEAYFRLASVVHESGDLRRAEENLHRALEHKPGFPEAHLLLSDVYERGGKLAEAARCLEAALQQRPDWVVALNNYGTLLRRLQKLPEAEAALRRAIAAAPDFALAYGSLGSVLLSLGCVTQALEAFRRGRELDPGHFELGSAELFTLQYSDAISREDLFDSHRVFGVRLEKQYTARFAPFRNGKNTARRLRVGYVSGDFCGHAIARFIIPLLERHSRSEYEIYCYAVGSIIDEVTATIRQRADVWRDSAAMSFTALADAINSDQIDILVDLSGHSGESRLAVFAQEPAPVQVSWLGYLSTTGMTRVHYRLCDHYTDPAGAELFHTEKLVRLPDSQWCYRARESVDYTICEAPPVVRNGFITFGSFNNVPKISSSALGIWSKILTQLPEARLVLVGVPEGSARRDIMQQLRRSGILESRINVVARVSLQEYFSWFNNVDIALDTTPYSGGTTTCDAIWMGVPVITVPGPRSISRSAGSILSAVGLTEWIASTPEDYVRLAIGYACGDAPLALPRKTLRQRMLESALMDEVRFARNIEHAYRTMWRAWCGGNPGP